MSKSLKRVSSNAQLEWTEEGYIELAPNGLTDNEKILGIHFVVSSPKPIRDLG